MINKIIEELEELRKKSIENGRHGQSETTCMFHFGGGEYLKDAVEIVKKYENDGWILCSERLPTETKYYNVTLNNSYVEFLYYNTFAETWYFMADGKEENNTNWEEECNNVTAWRELPQPYKGE